MPYFGSGRGQACDRGGGGYPRRGGGKRFTFKVTRSDTGPPLTTGTMVCDPSVAGKAAAYADPSSWARLMRPFEDRQRRRW
jgi:hypothetical protein